MAKWQKTLLAATLLVTHTSAALVVRYYSVHSLREEVKEELSSMKKELKTIKEDVTINKALREDRDIKLRVIEKLKGFSNERFF